MKADQFELIGGAVKTLEMELTGPEFLEVTERVKREGWGYVQKAKVAKASLAGWCITLLAHPGHTIPVDLVNKAKAQTQP